MVAIFCVQLHTKWQLPDLTCELGSGDASEHYLLIANKCVSLSESSPIGAGGNAFVCLIEQSMKECLQNQVPSVALCSATDTANVGVKQRKD